MNEKIIWKGGCFNCANHHASKYKHYAKIVTNIDTTKTNGYAFEGSWLNWRYENSVNSTDFVLEYCEGNVKFYRADDVENAIKERNYAARAISFIQNCAEYMKNKKVADNSEEKTDNAVITESLASYSTSQLENELKRRKGENNE